MEVIDTNRKTSSDSPEVAVRMLTPEDAAAYVALLEKNRQRMSDAKHKIDPLGVYESVEGLTKRLKNGEERRGIWADGQLVGGIDTTPTDRDGNQEVSYWLDKDSTRRGIGLVALKTLTAQKSDAGIRLEAHVEKGNTASWMLLDRAGYRESPMSDAHPEQYNFYYSAKKK